jgi:hypothetical protein
MHWLKIIYLIFMTFAFIASFAGMKDRRYMLFVPLLALSLGVELAKVIVEPLTADQRNKFHLFIAVEYALLSWIISNFIRSTIKKRIIRLSILILVPVLVLVQLKFGLENSPYQFLAHIIQTPFICVWTILYLFETAKQDEEFEIGRNPMFWISLGNLLFFGGGFFSYGFGSYLELTNPDMANTIFWIARILNILLYILYFIGFTCLWKRR